MRTKILGSTLLRLDYAFDFIHKRRFKTLTCVNLCIGGPLAR